MKKIILFLFISYSTLSFSQSMQVQNMSNYLRNKEYEKAKSSADAASIHETTKLSSKMWLYRGNVYKAIYSDTSKKVRDIDLAAEEKALEAYINCLKYDKDVIYKEDAKGPLVLTAAATRNKSNYYKQNKEFDNAIYCLELLELSLPFDFDQGIKRNNITKEKLLFDKFDLYKFAANKAKTIEYANKLIEANYKDSKIYTDMVKISLMDKDTSAALSYIEKGKIMFEDNMTLIGTEIDIFLARKKINELKDKLNKAIDLAPDNELLHAVLGQVYEKSGDLVNSEKEYLKALEIKPDYEIINFKLGAFYFNLAAEFNKKLNELPPKETVKSKDYNEKIIDNFKKAIPFLEKAFESNPDKAYKQRIFQAYSRLGETEKALKYK
jgi:tetratricopeptide (TPR) repeat protein